MTWRPWRFPLFSEDLTNRARLTSPEGSFGYQRSYYYHQGVDLYVKGPAQVKTVEAGIVVGIEDFTGPKAGHQHWLNTKAVLIAGKSGVVCYGEIDPWYWLRVGDKFAAGAVIGSVAPVLKPGQERPDIVGHSRHMLHLELYAPGTTESVNWHHYRGGKLPCDLCGVDDASEVHSYECSQPINLRDPTKHLRAAWYQVSEWG